MLSGKNNEVHKISSGHKELNLKLESQSLSYTLSIVLHYCGYATNE